PTTRGINCALLKALYRNTAFKAIVKLDSTNNITIRIKHE
ncbi:MAG: hypothetical protein ACI9W7_001541, partial [Porticoccaceae bacterium]